MGMCSSPSANSTTTTTNIPEWLQGPYSSLVDRAQTESLNPYQPYSGARIAGFTPQQQQALNNAGNLSSVYQQPLNQAMGATNQAARTASQFASGQQGQIKVGNIGYSPVSAGSVNAGTATVGNVTADKAKFQNIGYGQMGAAGTFGAGEAAQYMSPYQQAVTDIAKRNAVQADAVAKLGRNADAVNAGAFGGSRAAAIRESEAANNLAQLTSDLDVKGRQAAFENAQAQYERDRAARMGTEQFNINTRLNADQFNAANQFDASKYNVGNKLNADMFNTTNQFDASKFNVGNRLNADMFNVNTALDAGKFNSSQQMQRDMYNTTNQFNSQAQNAQNRLAGANLSMGAGSQLGNLAGLSQDFMGRGLDALLKAGGMQQDQNQASLDMGYNDFLNQRDYGRQQIAFLNNIMRGLPVTASGEITQTTPGPSSLSQIAGLAATGLGAYAKAQ